jgi:predicted nucleotide-binding protein (sugar kinase/HSP70/actin superfamily)
VRDEGRRVLASIEVENRMGVILAGRPYHYDPYINHGIPEIFSSLGIPLLTIDSLPDMSGLDLHNVRPELYNPFHSEIYAAGLFAAAHPCLEVVQLVSFGCGHDAIISDELSRIMNATSGKQPLVLKIDEGEALGALGIRIRSFVETVRRRRA